MAKAETLDEHGGPITISAITAFELWVGAMRKPVKKEREELETLIRTFPVVDYNSDLALLAGTIMARLYDSGRPIEPEDAMIAVTAIWNRDILLTRNVDHFGRIPDLRLESY